MEMQQHGDATAWGCNSMEIQQHGDTTAWRMEDGRWMDEEVKEMTKLFMTEDPLLNVMER